jgi:hypothetical protein
MRTKDTHTDATKYVQSIKDAVKRRFAKEYLAWLLAGKVGVMPVRGALSPIIAKAVCLNLEALA